MSHKGPLFGNPRPGLTYPERPGAYAVIPRRDGCFAFVRGISGRLFLPGGGIEEGETPEIALFRELAEEIGWSGRLVHSLGQASEYVIAMSGNALLVRGVYFQLDLIDRLPGPCEYEIVWKAPAAAASELARRCDAWAISQVRL